MKQYKTIVQTVLVKFKGDGRQYVFQSWFNRRKKDSM